MASFVMKNAKILICGGADVSTWCRSVRVNYSATSQDMTAFGASWKSFGAGLKDFSVDFEFLTDFASSVDGLLWNNIGNSIYVDIRQDSAATGYTNPALKGYVIVGNFAPLGASVGTTATQTVSCPGNGALTWSQT